jgi:hypothetical protein
MRVAILVPQFAPPTPQQLAREGIADATFPLIVELTSGLLDR